MRTLLVPVLVAGFVTVPVAAAGAVTKVTVGDNYFVRSSGVPTVSVDKGTAVKWVWKGRSLHNVAVSRGPVSFRSGAKTDGSYRKKLRQRGTYAIYCTVHGADDQSMKLVVR